MSFPRRLFVVSLGLLGTLALSAANPAPEDPQWARLRSMPREQRQRLAAQLKAFDSLPAAERDAIRQLDRQIAAESSDDRETDYAVLRHYHLWRRTLSDSQRNEVDAAAPDRRIAVVRRIMETQRAAQAAGPFLQRLSEFGAQSPFEMAYVIKVWLKLSLNEREEVLRLPEIARRERLHALGSQYKLKGAGHPNALDASTLYGEAERKYHLPPLPARSAAGKSPQEERQRRFRLNVAEYYRLETEPLKKPVEPAHLYQFGRELPAWLRATIEDVPPEDARWLLTRLYRLVFPNDEEIPLPKTGTAPAGKLKTAKPSSPAQPKLAPRAEPKKSTEPPPPPKPGNSAAPF